MSLTTPPVTAAKLPFVPASFLLSKPEGAANTTKDISGFLSDSDSGFFGKRTLLEYLGGTGIIASILGMLYGVQSDSAVVKTVSLLGAIGSAIVTGIGFMTGKDLYSVVSHEEQDSAINDLKDENAGEAKYKAALEKLYLSQSDKATNAIIDAIKSKHLPLELKETIFADTEGLIFRENALDSLMAIIDRDVLDGYEDQARLEELIIQCLNIAKDEHADTAVDSRVLKNIDNTFEWYSRRTSTQEEEVPAKATG